MSKTNEHGLMKVFHNIDYIFITFKLLTKNYEQLAKCLVPIGEEQLAWSLEERMAQLKSRTRRFTDEELQQKYKQEALKSQ